MKTSEVLDRAADLIEERGWGQGVEAMIGIEGLCAMGAIGLASTGRLDGDYSEVHACPAGQAVYEYLGSKVSALGGQDRVWSWNDDPERTAEQVIEVLRAAAVIEAARESEAAEVSA